VVDPILDLADDAQRLGRPVRRSDIPREFLVGEVGVVLILADRLYDVDPPTPLALGQFGAPRRHFQRGAEIDVVQLPLDEVAAEAGPDPVAQLQVGLGAVAKRRAGWDFICPQSANSSCNTIHGVNSFGPPPFARFSRI
jgi:hypothetical protein